MKNKISFIALCTISVILLSCKHTVSRYGQDDCIGVFMDEIFAFYVRDSEGNDLLDPSNPNGYLLDFMLSTIHSIKRENKYPMMCIYWNKKDRDIIRSKVITRRGNPQDPTDAGYCVFITWDTVWYNDKIIATDWKETKKRLLSPPVIIKEENR